MSLPRGGRSRQNRAISWFQAPPLYQAVLAPSSGNADPGAAPWIRSRSAGAGQGFRYTTPHWLQQTARNVSGLVFRSKSSPTATGSASSFPQRKHRDGTSVRGFWPARCSLTRGGSAVPEASGGPAFCKVLVMPDLFRLRASESVYAEQLGMGTGRWLCHTLFTPSGRGY
jgi:hypothetical protein